MNTKMQEAIDHLYDAQQSLLKAGAELGTLSRTLPRNDETAQLLDTFAAKILKQHDAIDRLASAIRVAPAYAVHRILRTEWTADNAADMVNQLADALGA